MPSSHRPHEWSLVPQGTVTDALETALDDGNDAVSRAVSAATGGSITPQSVEQALEEVERGDETPTYRGTAADVMRRMSGESKSAPPHHWERESEASLLRRVAAMSRGVPVHGFNGGHKPPPHASPLAMMRLHGAKPPPSDHAEKALMQLHKSLREPDPSAIERHMLRGTPAVLAAPSALGVRERNDRPHVTSVSEGIRVRHTAFMTIVFGTTTEVPGDALLRYNVNPGDVQSFPWLSRLAEAYTQYKIHGLRYKFVPQQGTGSTGRVMFGHDINPSGPSPVSLSDVYNLQKSQSDSVWKEQWFSVLHAGKAPGVYLRHGALPSGADRQLYDMGSVYVSGVGVSATTAPLGELHVEYDVSLLGPRPPRYPGKKVVGSSIGATADVTLGTEFVETGETPAQVVTESYPANPVVRSRIKFYGTGRWLLSYHWGGSSIGSLSYYRDGAKIDLVSSSGFISGPSTSACATYVVDVKVADTELDPGNFTVYFGAGTITSATLWIARVDGT